MKKKYTLLYIVAFIAAIGMSSCSDDDNTQKYYSNMTEIFQNMKGTYRGNVTMPDNTTSSLTFSIADENVGGTVETDVQVANFPLEGILAKLYPGDYHYATVKERDAYSAPIDSVGFQMNFMNFKTNDDRTAQLNFTYELNGSQHEGWAQVTTTGMFFSSRDFLNITFTVIDLAIDNTDMASLLPISYNLDAEKQ